MLSKVLVFFFILTMPDGSVDKNMTVVNSCPPPDIIVTMLMARKNKGEIIDFIVGCESGITTKKNAS